MARLKPASGFVLAVAGAISLWGAEAMANDELLKLQQDPKQWVMPLGNYSATRYSELDQITNENVKNLQVAWTFSTGVLRGHEGGPLVIGNMMYVHAPFPNTVFALVTTQLMQVIGLTLAGGLLLLWVSWKLWREIRIWRDVQLAADEEAAEELAAEGAAAAVPERPTPKTMRQAVVQIVLADVSMSLDNVLAVAGIARDHDPWILFVGLALSVGFMGAAASIIARLLHRFHWLAYVGLAIIFYVSVAMIWDGSFEMMDAIEDAGANG